jgi:ferritin-like metal-binding protein YciE
MQVENLRELLIAEIRDIYDAEEQIVDELPDIIDKVQSPQLKSALQMHLEETRGQILRLEQVFNKLGEEVEGETCAGMKGILKEGSDAIDDAEKGDVRDAVIIAACQKVEHYEIASYGCVRTYAKQLGLNDVAQLLQQTLDEEGNADKKLTTIAEQTVNVQAKKVA